MIKKEDFLIDDFLFLKNGFGVAPGLGNMGHLITYLSSTRLSQNIKVRFTI